MATNPPAYTTSLAISELRLDCGVTPHHVPNKALIDLFIDDHRLPDVVEPIVVFQDGMTPVEATPAFWVADGHHRIAAFKARGEVYIAANVYYGSRHDAMFYACRANGDRRGYKDKHAAVAAILREPELACCSDRMLAIRCKVHHTYISRMRKELGLVRPDRIITQGGYAINTDAIGNTHRVLLAEKATRVEQVQKLAARGMNAEQVAAELKLGVDYVRVLATRGGVVFGGSKTKKLNYRQIIDSTVMGLDASAAGLRTTGVVLDGLDKQDVAEWLESIDESLKTFTALRNKLRGYIQ